MQRLITLILLTGLPLAPTRAAEPYQTPVHINPQVPTPVLDRSGAVVPASSGYVPMRAGTLVPASGVNPNVIYPGIPLPTSYAPTGFDCPTCDKPDCADRGPSCLHRLKAWLCFQPTTRDALPKCRPHPYVGSVMGTFTCTSKAGCSSGNCSSGNCGSHGSKLGCGANGCGFADGSGLRGFLNHRSGCSNGCNSGGLGSRFGALFGGRGSSGNCVPPSDEVFPGYHFATPRPLTMGVANPPGIANPPAGEYRSYKPAPSGSPAPSQPKPYVYPKQSGTVGSEPLARPFTRP